MSLFGAIDVNLPAMALDVFALYLAAILILSIPVHLRYLHARPEGVYGPPPKILGRLRLPNLTLTQTMAAQATLIVALIGAIVLQGAATRACVLVALLAYFPAFAALSDLETNRRKTYLVPMILGILFLSPGIGGEASEPAPYWPIWLIKCAIVQVYVSGALQKLRNSGPKWAGGDQLQVYLAAIYMWEDTGRTRKLLERPRLCAVISAVVLAVQSTFWIILVIPQLTVVYLFLGAAFHVGTAITMKIYYVKYMAASYLLLALVVAYQAGLLSTL